MVPLGLQMTTGAFGELYLLQSGFVCGCRQDFSYAHQVSQAARSEAQGSDSPRNTPVRCPQNTSEDTLFSKSLLPRTTKVRVTI